MPRHPSPGGYRIRRQPEKAAQAQIVHLLRSIGATVYVLGTRRRQGDYQGTMMAPGLPDILTFLPPRVPHSEMLWIEVKAAGGRVSEAQAAFALCCQSAGVAHVTGGLQEVVTWLVERQYLRRENLASYRRPAEARSVTSVVV